MASRRNGERTEERTLVAHTRPFSSADRTAVHQHAGRAPRGRTGTERRMRRAPGFSRPPAADQGHSRETAEVTRLQRPRRGGGGARTWQRRKCRCDDRGTSMPPWGENKLTTVALVAHSMVRLKLGGRRSGRDASKLSSGLHELVWSRSVRDGLFLATGLSSR